MQDALVLSSDIMPKIKLPLSSKPVQLVVRLLQCCKHNAQCIECFVDRIGGVDGLSLRNNCLTVGRVPHYCSFWAFGNQQIYSHQVGSGNGRHQQFYFFFSKEVHWQRCHLELTTLPSQIKPSDVIVSIYNGAKTANMKRNLTPHSCPVFALIIIFLIFLLCSLHTHSIQFIELEAEQ